MNTKSFLLKMNAISSSGHAAPKQLPRDGTRVGAPRAKVIRQWKVRFAPIVHDRSHEEQLGARYAAP
jgi:hypothetical protein